MIKGIARQMTDTDDQVSGILVLTPAESKRLIAKAVVAMPQVKRALEKGRIIIANGTTTAFVAEEVLGRQVSKYRYAAGYIGEGKLAVTSSELVTEIQALRILAGVEATHVASGRIGGCQGAVTFVVEGTDEAVRWAFEVVEEVKGEKPVLVEKQ